jgi:signal transduction histidine kinase
LLSSLHEEVLAKDEQIRLLVRASSEAQRGYMEELGNEIHDRVIQPLVTAFQYLQTMQVLARDSGDIQSLALQAGALLKETIQETRLLMERLYPSNHSQVTLSALFQEDLRRMAKDYGWQADFFGKVDVPVPWEVELPLRRVVHEALNNICKHAQSRRVQVSLDEVASELVVEIRDWGVGFDVSEALNGHKVGGLSTMLNRAEKLGGALSIQSAPGQGTTVTLRVPKEILGLREGGSNA